MSEVPVVRDPPPEADRIRPLVLVAVGVVSMLVGFLLVYLPSRWGEPARRERPAAAEPQVREEKAAPRERPVLAVAPRPPESATPAPGSTAPEPAPEPTPPPTETAEPAPTPTTAAPATGGDAGSALQAKVGNLFHWRCWDEGADDPLPSEHCDRLRALEPQIESQLDAVATCARERATGAGKLSLGLEIDFGTKNVRFWGGRSSTVANAAEVSGCIRQRWRIDLEAIRHAHSRYTIFVPIDLVPR